jgi:hypothetical protein
VDGKGVVMRPEDLREATRRAAATRADTCTARLGREQRLHAKRMASVAAVYTIDPFVRTPEEILPPPGTTAKPKTRPRPEHKRVWASLEQTPDEVIMAMFEEADHRDPNRQKTWVALVDGNKTQIRILRQLARTRHLSLQIVVDFIHVAAYVWQAGLAWYPADSHALDSWVRVHLLAILRGKAGYVAAGMRRSARLRSLPAADRKPVDVCADYLLTYAPYLRYHLALSSGLPIATGVIEGACRHLVNDRMNLTGARWSLVGAEAVLRLRALRSSDDFDDYWVFHELCEFDLDGGVVAQNEVNLEARARAPMVHRLTGHVITIGDELVQEPRLEGGPEFRRARFDEAALEAGCDADVEGGRRPVPRAGRGESTWSCPSGAGRTGSATSLRATRAGRPRVR